MLKLSPVSATSVIGENRTAPIEATASLNASGEACADATDRSTSARLPPVESPVRAILGIYDHYADKFALLESMVAARFHELAANRCVTFDETCASALTGIVSAVCDFLAGTPGMECPRQRQMGPHLESAVIAVVRRMILDGLARHHSTGAVSPGMIAATVSWAIYGAAKEWVQTPNRSPSEEIVGTVVTLVSPYSLRRMPIRRLRNPLSWLPRVTCLLP